jgi:hypothetical protein
MEISLLYIDLHSLSGYMAKSDMLSSFSFLMNFHTDWLH